MIRTASILISLSLAAALGCSDDAPSATPVSASACACVRDAALLATHAACSRDIQCPCGSYCDRGRCTYECTEDSECDGFCDYFGRCRNDDDGGIRGVESRADGVLAVHPPKLTVYDPDLEIERPIRVSADLHDLTNVRVTASDGLVVRCTDAFVAECTIASIPAGDAGVTVTARTVSGSEATEWRLTVFSDTQTRVVTFAREDVAPRTTEPTPGVYAGQIWLSQADASLESDVPYSQELTEARFQMLHVPLELKVYADGTLYFRDQPGVLPDPGVVPESWVFQVREDGSFDAVVGGEDLSRTAYLTSSTTAAVSTRSEVTFSSTGSLKVVGESLSGRVRVALEGMGLANAQPFSSDERLTVTWGFSARRTGDIPAGDTAPALGDGAAAPSFHPFADRYGDALPWDAEVADCGPMVRQGTGLPPADDLEHVEFHVCYDHPGSLASVPFAPAAVGLSELGDIGCNDSSFRPTSTPFFTYADRTVPMTPEQLLSRCIDDLAWVHADPVAGTPGGGGGCLDEVSDVATPGRTACIDGPVALRAIGLAFEAVERAGYPDSVYWQTTDDQRVRVAHRLLQQWLQIHAFVARETVQQSDPFLGGDIDDLSTALSASIAGWNLLLHPRVAGRLFHARPDLLADPDYRGDDATPMDRDQSQGIGLPVAMVNAMTAQLEAATALIRRGRFETTPIPAEVVQTLRYATVVGPMAAALKERARLTISADDEYLSWEIMFFEATEAFNIALEALLAEWRGHTAGENPLGISDEDLPLYRGLFNPDAAGVRFSAVSSYLIDEWADTAVTDAEEAQAAADAAWTALLERQLQQARTAGETDRRIEEIKRLYGEKVLTLCGSQPGVTDAAQVFDDPTAGTLSPNGCFIDRTIPECQYDEAALYEKLTADDIVKHMCVVAGLNNRLGDKAELSNDELNARINDMQGELNDILGSGGSALGGFAEGLDPGFWDMGKDLVSCGTSGGCNLDQLTTLDHVVQLESDADIAAFDEARQECGALVPDGVDISERVPPLDLPDCYRGTLGELALAARAAAKDLEVAVSELQDQTDAYENAVNQCVLANRGMEQIAAVSSQLGALKGRLESYMGPLNAFNEVAGLTISSADTLAGLSSFSPASWNTDAQTGEVSMSGGWAERSTTMGSGGVAGSVFDFASGKIMGGLRSALGIDDIQAMHDDFVAEWQEKIENALCFNEAAMHLVDADTYAKRAERSRIDLSSAILKMRNYQQELTRFLVEGRQRVEREKARERSSLVNDVWNDLWVGDEASYRGKLDDYRRKLRIAQRMVYLAVRAVEYEWQVSRSDRGDTLAATTPAELRLIVDNLATDVAAGGLGGQTPHNLLVVLSLKEHLLQLEDRSNAPDGYHTCNAAESFQTLLTSPRYAAYDRHGNYRGQLIPFSIAPLGVLGIGDPSGIPLLTGSDCAERIWSVNASILGDNIVDNDSSFTRIELLQRNTFYSQWCTEPGIDDPALQESSVRPSRNLFKDPIWSGDYGSTDSSESEYVRARLQAYHNITRAQLEAESYEQGDSQELAARALYGEYGLFIAGEQLAIDGSGGLRLNHVDDVLIRIDYVSAAKRW